MNKWQGIRRLAEPKDTLSKRYQQFQRRLARHYLNSMEANPADDDNDTITQRTTHDSTTHTNTHAHTNTHSMNENTNNRGEERGRERRALGGLTAAQASSDNRQPHPSQQPLSHSQPQPLPLTSSAPVSVRTSHAVSTSTSRNVRAVSTSSSVRSTVEDRSSNATFRIFSDNPGKKEKTEKDEGKGRRRVWRRNEKRRVRKKKAWEQS